MPGRPPGCSGDPNPNFVAEVQEVCGPGDTILDMCATGGRGAVAVNALAQAGFMKAYNIVNGFEGDRVDDPGSVFHGKHMRNGWKNAGLPWGYDFHPDLMWVAE
jgi:rhodanese-related sulfurtransferase